MPTTLDPESIVEVEEEITPEDAFNGGFDEIEDVSETEDTADEVQETDDLEDETEADTDAEASEEAEDSDDTETEELSALELAEKQAREKFLKKDEKKDDDTDASKEPKEEAQIEIDFTDVDSNPAEFVNKLIDGVKDADKKDRLKETLESYPEIGEIAAIVARELVGRQKVKTVGGEAFEIPEEFKGGAESFAEMRKTVEAMQMELAENRYFNAIEKEVPGARSIAGSEKFLSWLDSQSVGINTLANSGDPQDAVAVLKAYREYESRNVAKTVDEKAKAKKKKVDASLKKTVQSSGSHGNVDPADDFIAGFNG